MKEQNNYICKQASIDEIIKRWDYEVNLHNDNLLYPFAKKEFVEEAIKGTRIAYVGMLDNEIICDATVIIKKEGILNESQNKDNLVSDNRCFLCGLRTNKEYENKGYFSKLYKFMEEDLKRKGYTEISLSVNVEETRNLMIYFHWNYTNFIRTEIINNKDKNYIFNYYYKKIS